MILKIMEKISSNNKNLLKTRIIHKKLKDKKQKQNYQWVN